MPDEGGPSPLAARSVPRRARIPRLEQILGCGLGELDASVIARLTADRVTEDLVLEFKSEHYRQDDRSKSELAKDVAALANAAGGVILLGIREDDRGAAAEIVGVDVSDGERRRIVDLMVKRIAPLVPDVEVWAVPMTPSEGDLGIYVIAVPPSVVAPHAVVDGDRLSWPVREDTQVRWMREPEIARRYRDRFTGLSARDAVLETVFAEGVAGLRDREAGWLAIAGTPDRAGHLQVSRDALEEARAWLPLAQSRLPRGSFSASLATVGRRRLTFGDEAAASWRMELHADGSAFCAIRIADIQMFESGRPAVSVPADALEVWTVQLLGLVALHAVRVGASGDVSVRGSLLGVDRDAGGLWTTPDGRRSVSLGGVPVAIIEPRLVKGLEVGVAPVGGSRTVQMPTATTQVATLTVTTDPADLVAAAAAIASDLLTEFGIPEPRLLRRDGHVGVREGSHDSESLTAWASKHGLPLDA